MFNRFKKHYRYDNVHFTEYTDIRISKIGFKYYSTYFCKSIINFWFWKELKNKIKKSIPVCYNDNFPNDENGEIFKSFRSILYFYPNFENYVKDNYYLFRRSDNKYRIVRCISVDKLGTFPPIFDGSETPGIGYECIGEMITDLKLL